MTTVKKRKKIDPMRVLFLICFTILPVVHFLVMYVFVNLNSFAMGFQQNAGGKVVWTLANFSRFFSELTVADSPIMEALKNTFLTFGINLIMFPIGILVSYFLYKKIWCYKFFRITFFLPSILLSVIVINIYREFLMADTVTSFIQNLLHLDYQPELLAQYEFANKAVLICMVWLAFPGNLIIWGGTFSRIPDAVLDAAKIDGVSWWQEMLKIIIPMVWPTFALTLMLMFTGIFGSTGPVFLLTGGNWGTQTLNSWMYIQVYEAGSPLSNKLNYLSAVGLMISAVAILIAVVIRRMTSRLFGDAQY